MCIPVNTFGGDLVQGRRAFWVRKDAWAADAHEPVLAEAKTMVYNTRTLPGLTLPLNGSFSRIAMELSWRALKKP